jgi:hypothetical protein
VCGIRSAPGHPETLNPYSVLTTQITHPAKLSAILQSQPVGFLSTVNVLRASPDWTASPDTASVGRGLVEPLTVPVLFSKFARLYRAALLPALCAALVAVGTAMAQPDLSAEAERRAVEQMQRRGEQVPPPEERRRLIEMFLPNLGRATFDTRLVRLELTGVRLAIPANYIAAVDRDADGQVSHIALHVFLFDMQGVTIATAPCMRQGFACPEYGRVNISGSARVSARQSLANVLQYSRHSLEQLPGPNGLEMMRYRRRAPDESSSFWLYAEQPGEDQLVLAYCHRLEGGRIGNCTTSNNDIVGLGVRYILPGNHIDQLLHMDAAIRSLLHRFIE